MNHLVQMPHCSSISPSCLPFSSSTDPACVSMASGPSGAASCGRHSAGYRRQSPQPPAPLSTPRTIGSFPLAVSVSTAEAAAAASPGTASPLQGHKRRLSAAQPQAAASQPRVRSPPTRSRCRLRSVRAGRAVQRPEAPEPPQRSPPREPPSPPPPSPPLLWTLSRELVPSADLARFPVSWFPRAALTRFPA